MTLGNNRCHVFWLAARKDGSGGPTRRRDGYACDTGSTEHGGPEVEAVIPLGRERRR